MVTLKASGYRPASHTFGSHTVGSPSEEKELAGSSWVTGFMRKTRANRGGVIWKMRVYRASAESFAQMFRGSTPGYWAAARATA